jgi:hypothetical protein
MKSRVLFFALLTAASVASAQQTATVQMQCHDLASNANFVGPDEVVINGMACHSVKQAAPQNQNAALRDARTATPTPTQAPPAVSTDTGTQPGTVASSPLVLATPENMKIKPGARVYIVPMDGFENYLAAALGKKKVPLVPVFDQSQADYVISGTSVDKKAGWAKIVFMGNVHSDNSASVTMTDRRTGAIVYAYAVDKKSTMHGQQTTAEACAKHLKAHMEAHE